MKKSKEELSKIAKKAVETKKIKIQSEEIVGPMLHIIRDGKQYHLKDIEMPLARHFGISEEEVNQTLLSGQKRFLYRLSWAKWFLKTAGLLDVLEQAKFKINDTGLNFLKKHGNFTLKEFTELPKWNEHIKKEKAKKQKKSNIEKNSDNDIVKEELLEKIKDGSPYLFEKLMVILLEKMGYGVGVTTKKSHDGGIDGIVTADKLGLSEIYVQTKRYSGTVPISHIKEFIGTIQTTKTKTGVFITSGGLPESAHEYILKSGLNIQLIDGQKLSDLMYDFNVGVKSRVVDPVKYLDEGFFVEEEL